MNEEDDEFYNSSEENRLLYEFEKTHKEDTIKSYLKYLDGAYNVKKITFEKKRDEIYTIANLVMRHRCYTQAYFFSGCTTYGMVLIELIEDIESSIFLSIHGKYRVANILLRRWLETAIFALYHDFLISEGAEKPEEAFEKCEQFLKNPDHLHFSGKNNILAKLNDSGTNIIATELLHDKILFYKASDFQKYIEILYSELSKCVHYGGMKPPECTKFDFAEFNEILFNQWFEIIFRIEEICNILTLIKFPKILNPSKNENGAEYPTLEETKLQKLKELLIK